MKELFQQGDCLIVKSRSLPKDAKKVAPQNGRYVLVEGEHSGHAHAIYEEGWGDMYQSEKGIFIDVKVPVTVKHEEHFPQIILPGIYEISRVREIDPFTEEIHTVQD